jgi:hypothetical protein
MAKGNVPLQPGANIESWAAKAAIESDRGGEFDGRAVPRFGCYTSLWIRRSGRVLKREAKMMPGAGTEFRDDAVIDPSAAKAAI